MPSLPLILAPRRLLMSAFYPGYLLTQIPAGALAQAYGSKLLLFLNLAGTAACFGFLPFAFAASSSGSVLLPAALLNTMGLFQGSLIPGEAAIHSAWLQDTPLRPFVMQAMFLCHAATSFVATWSTPKLAERGGWRTVCITYGVVTGAIAALWQMLVSNRSPRTQATAGSPAKKKAVEWQIFREHSALSTMMCQVADNNMSDTLYLWAPTYFSTVLGCRPLAVPAYLAVPQLIQTFGGFPTATAEALLLHRGFDKLRLRRWATGLGSVVESVGAVLYVRAATAPWAAAWLCVQQLGQLGHRAGFEQSYLEVGGPDAAILSSVGNCAANGAGLWTPPLSVLLRHLSGGSWLPHVAVAGALKLLTALYYAWTVKLTPARDATASA
jgi:hypothetical protein